MAKYKAYARMYYKGKPIGKPYLVLEGKDRKSLRERVMRGNKAWNSLKRKTGYRVTLSSIK